MQDFPPLSLYIHVPWCVRKCPYCDFNSHEVSGDLPETAYVAALLSDLRQDLHRVAGRTVETVFIGGGTPSLFHPSAIESLLKGMAEMIAIVPTAEITLEANPGTAECGKFIGFREAGINRLSMGVQSFNDRHLQDLGRIHGSFEAIAAANMAVKAGFDNFNLDLMFGLPKQTLAEALDDIQRAVGLNPPHLSFYQLTLEPNTLFHKYPPALPGDETIWAMQEACQSALGDNAYLQYEVSAYAKAGFRCRHNENYWRFGDYLGIGAGAHGKLTDASGKISRIWKIRHPARYLENAGTLAGIGGCDLVAEQELPIEFMMNHLRLREGFCDTLFGDRTGLPLTALEPALSECVEAGLLERNGGVIRCTDKGWNFLDNVLERFIAS